MKIAMGQYDAPLEQKQPLLYIDPYIDNIAVYGGPMSGKTTFIKTFLVQMSRVSSGSDQSQVYILDFGGNIGTYGNMHNICACFDGSNEENIKRVFKVIDNRLVENKHYKDTSHVILVIDNLNSFWDDERYSLYQEILIKFSREGLSYGLSIVITLNDITGMSRLLGNFRQKVAFEMPSDKYYEIFNSKVNKPMRLPGRGLVNIDEVTYEFQCALPFENSDLEERTLLSKSKENKTYPIKYELKGFPEVLNDKNIDQYIDNANTLTKNSVIVGVDYYTHEAICIKPFDHPIMAIYGNKTYNRVKFLKRYINGISKLNEKIRWVFVDDGRGELDSMCKDGQFLINSEFVVLTSLIDFRKYLEENKYVSKSKSDQPRNDAVINHTEKYQIDNPYTVFVIQSKSIYADTSDARNILNRLMSEVVAETDRKKCSFVFSDVKTFPNLETGRVFNCYVSLAILFDNLSDVVGDIKRKSVFEELDAKEIKNKYARCSNADAFCYYPEKEDIRKIKLIE